LAIASQGGVLGSTVSRVPAPQGAGTINMRSAAASSAQMHNPLNARS
jgi:hypothetical protein